MTGTILQMGSHFLVTIKDAPNDLRDLVNEVSGLNGILSALKSELEDESDSKKTTTMSRLTPLFLADGPVEQCGKSSA